MTANTPPMDECRTAFEDAINAIYGVRPYFHPRKMYGAYQGLWYGWQACWNTRQAPAQELTEDEAVKVMADAMDLAAAGRHLSLVAFRALKAAGCNIVEEDKSL